jgi:excisionase family DNA binding protein
MPPLFGARLPITRKDTTVPVFNHGLHPALDIPRVAELFNCHPRTVLRMIHRGELAAVKVGSHWRIARAAALAYLEGGAK